MLWVPTMDQLTTATRVTMAVTINVTVVAVETVGTIGVAVAEGKAAGVG